MPVSTLIVDGGGTSTDVAVVSSGQIRARAELPAFKPLRYDNRADEFCRALGGFLATAHLSEMDANIRFCVVGMSGVWSEHERTSYANAFCDAWMQYVDSNLPAMTVISDVELVHLASLGTAPGIVLIAGTGSIAVARTGDGRLIRSGGWGPRIDDEGGGFWMGREALRATTRMIDKRGAETLLLRPVAAYLRCDPDDKSKLESSLRSASIDNVARLARAVLTYAEEGDAVAQSIAQHGAAALHAIIRPLLQNQQMRLVLHGSLFSSVYYRTMVETHIRADYDSVDISFVDDLLEAISTQLHRAE
ncbi:MAG: BadF/BadG/BcrA/BcrD ATPase family protein [bacterium]|nr:BadF/BadG/BcrA/BcrD ATPase family protein [bacterium]